MDEVLVGRVQRREAFDDCKQCGALHGDWYSGVAWFVRKLREVRLQQWYPPRLLVGFGPRKRSHHRDDSTGRQTWQGRFEDSAKLITETPRFSMVRQGDEKNGTAKCHTPNVGPVKLLGFEACVQPTIWVGKTLKPTSPGVYKAEIKKPLLGWTGAYVEVFFPSDTGLKSEYQFTTAGMVWPQTLPFPDCHGLGCDGVLV